MLGLLIIQDPCKNVATFYKPRIKEGSLKGAVEAKKALGPALRLIKLLEGMKEINILPVEGSLNFGPGKSIIFFTESK